MNLVNPYIFAPPALPANTFIGGVSSTINTTSQLATKLGISVSNISSFSIIGSDVKCNITGNYSIPVNAFNSDLNITYYNDADGLVTSLSNGSFYRAVNLVYCYFKNAVSVGNQSFDGDGQTMIIKTIYTPSATSYGSSVSNNTVFRDNYPGLRVYVNPILATANSGSPDGDLALIISNGGYVRYVTSFTPPSQVDTLSSSNIYDTAVKLVFTQPSSSNPIDYYEVYINGVYRNNIYSNSGYASGLSASTNHNITIVAVDVYFNKSIPSNSLSISTNLTAYPYKSLLSYYRLESDFRDSYRGLDCVHNGVTFPTGKMGSCASFNGSVYASVAPILKYGSFTISAWIKTTSGSEMFIFSNRGEVGGQIIGMAVVEGKLFSRLRSSASTGITSLFSTVNVNNGVWRHVAMRFDIVDGLQTNFVDGVLNSSEAYTGGVFDNFKYSNFGVEASISPSYGKFNGSMDGIAIFNSALSNSEINNIYNIQNSGIELIQ